jgi:predicted Abi (CAAX) family protease
MWEVHDLAGFACVQLQRQALLFLLQGLHEQVQACPKTVQLQWMREQKRSSCAKQLKAFVQN